MYENISVAAKAEELNSFIHRNYHIHCPPQKQTDAARLRKVKQFHSGWPQLQSAWSQ
jgi:hypothetical protein